MSNPLVSIVIPAYNAASFLADTIENALKQTYTNVDIIVIDDGSKDASYSIAKQFENGKVKVVTQPNSGASAARNHGIRLAKGDYIQFQDADDLLHPEKIEHQISTLEHYSNLHLIGSTWQRFIDNLNQIFGDVAPKTEQDVQVFNNVQWLIDRPMMVPNTWLVSKELVALAGMWNEEISLNDDGEYFYRVIAASKGVIIDRKAAVYYRSFNTTSLSSTGGQKAMLSWIKSIQSYKKILQEVAGNRGNESVDRYFDLLSYWCLNELPDLYKVCRSQMYNPDKHYPLDDQLVNRLAGITGLAKAKQIRNFITAIKRKPVVKRTIKTIKRALGKPTY